MRATKEKVAPTKPTRALKNKPTIYMLQDLL